MNTKILMIILKPKTIKIKHKIIQIVALKITQIHQKINCNKKK